MPQTSDNVPPVSELQFLLNTGNYEWDSLTPQLVKNPPAMQENPLEFLGREDLLEKGQATHSSIPGLPLWLSW